MKVTFKEKYETLKITVKWMYKASPALMWAVTALVILNGLLVLIEPYLFKLIVDHLVSGSHINIGTAIGIGIFGVLAIFTVSRTIQNIFWDFTDVIRRYHNIKIERYSMHQVLSKISSIDISYFENPKYYNTLYQARESYWRIINSFWDFTWMIRNIVSVAVIIGALFVFDWRIVALIIAGSIPTVLMAFRSTNTLWSAFVQGSPISKQIYYYQGILSETPQAVKEVRILGLRNFFLKRFRDLYDKYIATQGKAVRKQLIAQVVVGTVEGIVAGIAAWIVVVSFSSGNITIGELTFIWTLLFTFSANVRYFMRSFGELNTHITFISPLVRIMKLENKIKDPVHPKPFPKKISQGIEFRNVTFYYQGSKKPALKNFNLFIKPGESIAIVGENGSGKTTLVKLLARLYEPQKGEILIDGVNIKEYALNDLYDNIGVIFQDFMKYETLAQENIGFGRIKQLENKKRIHDAASKSGAWDFITDLENKYKTYLGRRVKESGVELSVGQWQKIALARAFFRDSQIMILDEPTAAVDAKAEYELFQKFEYLTKNKITLLISHRFSTVRMAHRIIVVDKGAIKEVGSHKELLKKDGIYANLFKLQAKGYK